MPKLPSPPRRDSSRIGRRNRRKGNRRKNDELEAATRRRTGLSRLGRGALYLAEAAALVLPVLLIAHPVSYVPFIMAVLLVGGSFAYLQVLRRSLDVSVSDMAASCERGQSSPLSVTLVNSSVLPFPRIELVFFVTDLFGGYDDLRPVSVSLGSRERATLDFDVSFAHLGSYRAGVRSVVVYDLLGIFSHTRRHGASRDVTVCPRKVDMASVGEMRAMPDEARSALRPVAADDVDYSNVREYRFGDQMKTIHWNLSSKSPTHTMYTRLFEAYVNPSLVIVIDPVSPTWDAEDLMCLFDGMVEVAAALSDAARLAGVDAEVRYLDKGGVPSATRLSNVADVEGLISGMMRITPEDEAGRSGAVAEELLRGAGLRSHGFGNVALVGSRTSAELIATISEIALHRKNAMAFIAVPRMLEGKERDRFVAPLRSLEAVALALSSGENVYEDAEGNWLYLVLVPTLLATACFLLTRTILGSTLWFVVAAFACCLVQAFYEVGEVGMSLVASACALMLVVHRNFQLGLEHADLARRPSPARNFAASVTPVAAVAAVALAVWFGIIAPLSPGVLDVKLLTDYRQPPIEEWKGVIKANPTYNTDLTTENLVEGFLYTTDDLVEDMASDITIDATSLLEQQQEQETDGGDALDAGEDTGGGVDEDFDEEETEEECYDAQSYSWQFPWIIVRIVLVVLLVGAVVGYFVGRRAWRRWNLERILALPPREQAVQLYLFLLERLRRIGFSVPAGLTLAEYASSSARQMDMLTEETRVAFTDITQTYERCAYGKLEPSEEDVAPLVEYYLWFWKAARTQLGNFRYFFKSFRLWGGRAQPATCGAGAQGTRERVRTPARGARITRERDEHMKLEAKDVQCGWDKGSAVQRYVSFSVGSGEVCCILGPNGCGKTTLLKTVMGIIPRQGGLVNIDGKDVEAMSPKEIASALAFVSQGHTPPFPYRVRDVVLLGRTEKVGLGQPSARDVQIADSVLADMGILHLREQPYTDISGGELQLTMIARALAQEPQLLVLDEPTAALDYGNAMRVVAKIRELANRGYGVLMTTHSPDHAFMLDSNVVLLQRDRPMQFGPCTSVITERNMRDAYGVDVETKEFLMRDGSVVRMCAPAFDKMVGLGCDAPAASESGAADAGVAAEAAAAAGAQPAGGKGKRRFGRRGA